MAEKNELATRFNYELVSKDEAAKLECMALEVYREATKRTAAILEIGAVLIRAQTILSKHKTGTFTARVESECGFTPKSAYNYMAATRAFSNCENVSQLEPSAMYALAENDKAKKAALKLADKGELVTHKRAMQLVAASEPDDEPDSEDSEPDSADSTAMTVDDMPCANCGGIVYIRSDDGGDNCKKCNHPYGEPVGDVDEDGEEGWKTQRAKATKTLKAAVLAVDDLHDLKPNADQRRKAVQMIHDVMDIVESW